MNSLFAFIEHNALSQSVRQVIEQGVGKQTFKNAGIDISYADTIAGSRIGIGTGADADSKFQKAENDRYLICFSGKILFNSNIQSQLGNDYSSNNDAQNVLLLYQQNQTQIFSLLQGYWSLVIWDKSTCTLMAAKDHFGNQPLYYFQNDHTLGIASQAKALYAVFPQSRTLNAETIGSYLGAGNIFTRTQQFFSDIHSLPPSHFLQYNLHTRQLQVQAYYTLPFKACTAPYNEYEEPYFADNLRQQVIDTVKTVFAGRSSMAIDLSGGLGSTTIACVAHQFCPETSLTAFTLVNHEDGGESLWAEKTAQAVNAKWVEVPCSAQNIIDEMQDVINAQGIPLFSMSTIARYKMIQSAHEHGFNSIVNGLGSDEMLAGYAFFFLPFLHFLRSQWLIKDYFREIIHSGNSSLRIKDLALWKLKEKAKQYYFSSERLLKKNNPVAYQSIVNQSYHALKDKDNSKIVLNEYLYEYYTRYLPYVMRWDVCAASSFNMECIMPFACSTDLAEYVFQIPSTQKIHSGWNKYMLRRAMIGLVPDEILWKKEKSGFYISEKQWYEKLEPLFKTYISEQSSDEHILLDPVLNQWENQYRQNIHFRRFAFRVYAYLQWRNWLQKLTENN